MARQQAKLEAVQAVKGLIDQRLDASNGSVDRRKVWLIHNFQRPLEDLMSKADQNASAYLVVNLLVIGGGFATSGVAVATRGSHGASGSWFVFGIGLLVAIAGGLSQQFRFGFRSSERRTLVLAFFNEGWHFAMPAGVYGGDVDTAWEQFSERVDKLNERAAAVESIESELPKKPKTRKT